MGWRGALRTIAAAQRASERESLRRQREFVRLSKQRAKLTALHQAAHEVQEFENRLEQIISIHKDCGSPWNWRQLADRPPPVAPKITNTNEVNARKECDAYQPTFFDKLFRWEQRKREELDMKITAGKEADLAVYNSSLQKFEAEKNDWSEMLDLSKRILSGDIDAFRDALEELGPFSELKRKLPRQVDSR